MSDFGAFVDYRGVLLDVASTSYLRHATVCGERLPQQDVMIPTCMTSARLDEDTPGDSKDTTTSLDMHL